MHQNQNASSEIIPIHCALVLKVHNLEIIIAFNFFQIILIWAFFTYKIVLATPDEEDSNLSRDGKSKQITPKTVSK